MQVELYRQEQKTLYPFDEPVEDVQERIDALEVKHKRVSTLGFFGQSQLYWQQIWIIQNQIRMQEGTHPLNFYQEISKDDFRIWQKFLPRAYMFSPKQDGGFTENSSLYKFDLIPEHVLDELVFCRSLSLFTEYSIRTPEQSQDPACFGHYFDHGAHHWREFLIARWGESLIAFEDIRRHVEQDMTAMRSHSFRYLQFGYWRRRVRQG